MLSILRVFHASEVMVQTHAHCSLLFNVNASAGRHPGAIVAASGMLEQWHLLTNEDDYLRDIAEQLQRCERRIPALPTPPFVFFLWLRFSLIQHNRSPPRRSEYFAPVIQLRLFCCPKQKAAFATAPGFGVYPVVSLCSVLNAVSYVVAVYSSFCARWTLKSANASVPFSVQE